MLGRRAQLHSSSVRKAKRAAPQAYSAADRDRVLQPSSVLRSIRKDLVDRTSGVKKKLGPDMQKMVEFGDGMASPGEVAKENNQPNTAELDIDDIRSKIRLHAIQTCTSDTPFDAHEQTRVMGAEASTQRRRETTTRSPEHIGKQLGMLLKRPDAPRKLSVLLLLVMFVFDPIFVTLSAAMTIFIGMALAYAAGPDRVRNWLIEWYKDTKESDPDKAERIRQRAARASQRLSEITDQLPDTWTTGLYLPDFEEPDEIPEKFYRDPFEQLIAEQRVSTSAATRNNAGSFFSLAALTKSERWDRDRSVRTVDAQVPNDQ